MNLKPPDLYALLVLICSTDPSKRCHMHIKSFVASTLKKVHRKPSKMPTAPHGLSDNASSLSNERYMNSLKDTSLPDDKVNTQSVADSAAAVPDASSSAASTATTEPPQTLISWITSFHKPLTAGVYGCISSYRDSGLKAAMMAEHKLLSQLPFFHSDLVPSAKSVENDAHGPYAITRLVDIDADVVDVSGSKPQQHRYINTFMMDNDGDRDFDSAPSGKAIVIGGFYLIYFF